MSTDLMTTALPCSLADDAGRHLTAFVTHKLTPAADATLADFPAVASWVSTLQAGRWLVTASTLPEPVVATVVSAPDQAAWDALLPPTTLVRGFPTPTVLDAPWESFRAHAMDEIGGGLHLVAMLVSPLQRPPADNLIARATLGAMSEVHGGARRLLQLLQERGRPSRPRVTKSQRDAMQTLSSEPLRREHDNPPEDRPPDGAVAMLVRTQAQDERHLTRWLDQLIERDDVPEGMLGVLTDVHRARRYYQRPQEQVGYEPRPVEGATTPRPVNDEPDFHQLAASAGSTPALLRRLGLAVDLVLPEQARAALATATWVSVRFEPDPDTDAAITVTDPPRTAVHVAGGAWQARADGDEWFGGRLAVGDPDRFRVLVLDPDATALQTEQNLRNVTGEVASDLNGDTANGAPTALRSTGFSLARRDRVATTRSRVATAAGLASTFGAAGTPPLPYESVVRGLRLEVRTDGAGPWRSLHDRRVDVLAADGTTVLTDVADAGYLPLTTMSRSGSAGDAASPCYLHEVVAGWDGWSLSAPRPGKVIVQTEDGAEVPVDEPPVEPGEPQLGRVRSRVEPGSLPRLRYGHSYEFRVRGVDLAGNDVPDAPPAINDPELAALARSELRAATAAVRATPVADAFREGVAALRADSPEPALGVRRRGTPPRPVSLSTQIRDVTGASLVLPLTALHDTERRLASMLRATTAGVSEATRVRDAVVAATATIEDLVVHPAALVDPEIATPGTAPGAPVETAPMPFLRWHPVPPPALVARHELTPGESLQRLVIREGETTQRHLVPPKTTQLEAELHGELDEAIGSTDPALQRRAYAWSLRERGTLLDLEIPDLDDPGALVPQPGMSLASRPGANPETAVTLQDLADRRGTPLGEGQYVLHDVDQLVTPYLPDPAAAGVALMFLDAGSPHTLTEPRVLQAVVVPYAGTWPRVEPLRLVLVGGAELGATVEGNVVHVTLPAGEQVRVATSSSLRAQDLRDLGLWRTAEQTFAAAHVDVVALLRRAAASGWTWWLTPSEELRLVHATPRPAAPPVLHDLAVLARPAGSTVAALLAITEVHGASTARIALESRWSEWVDDVSTPGPVRVDRVDVPVRSQVLTGERYGLLMPWEDLSPATGVPLHKAIQTFPDTHHRRVTCTLVGATRYAEFFAAEDLPGEDDPASRSEPVALTVPSSARPAAPVVVETVPLIHWEDGVEPDQPFARRRTRRSGARLWIDRPWYSSGDGEVLGVILGGDAIPHSASSRWGRDPGLQATAEVPASGQPPLLSSTDLLFVATDAIAEPGTTADVPARPGGPVLVAPPQPLVDLRGGPPAGVIGYPAEFHPGRGQWFVDVALDAADQLWPFVRLAVARYQPASLPGCSLSPVVMTDWVQPLPERTATLSRPDADHVQLTVTGAAATYRGPDRPGQATPLFDEDDPRSRPPTSPLDAVLLPSRLFVATLQERGSSDLEWTDHATVRLPAVGQDPENAWQITWSDALPLPEPLPLQTPPTRSDAARYRVLVEELEVLEADREHTHTPERRLTRVVYADTFDL